MLGLVVLGVIWYMGLGILDLAYADGFSPEGVLGNLPLVLQGQVPFHRSYRTHRPRGCPILILPLLAIKLMNSRDL